MTGQIDAKCRLCRREGRKLFLKGTRCFSAKCPIERKGAIPPGQHGFKSMRKKISVYGQQLREKQKVKRIYGLREAQFRKIFNLAARNPSATGTKLFQLLETRLDNIIYRLGFASSRAAARQLVRHGHILVNGNKVSIPSYQVQVKDKVSLTPAAAKIKDVAASLSDSQKRGLPAWLKRQNIKGELVRLPERQDLDQDINEQLIVEFYSR